MDNQLRRIPLLGIDGATTALTRLKPNSNGKIDLLLASKSF